MGDNIRVPAVNGFDYRVVDVQDVYRDTPAAFRRALVTLTAVIYPAL